LLEVLSDFFRLSLDNKKTTQSGFFIYWIDELARISFASVG